MKTRTARVKISPLYRISFKLKGESRSHQLLNLSVGGASVLHEKDTRWQVGIKVRGSVWIEQEEYPIEALIRHVDDESAGCEFTEVSVDLKRAIQAYLRLEILAVNLHPVAPKFLKPDPRGTIAWFTDGRQNEIHCIESGSRLVRFHTHFFGHHVEWDEPQGLRAGTESETSQDFDNTGPRALKGSELLEMKSAPSPETLHLARIFVQNATHVPERLRSQIQTKLI